MKSRENTLKYGMYSFSAIAVFFLAMKLFGFENVVELRAFNLVFVIYFTNRLARANVNEIGYLDYVGRLSSVFTANLMSLFLSVVSFYLYVKVIDPGFLSYFDGGIIWGSKPTLGRVIVSLLLEGVAGSIIVSFATMQYWKDVKVLHES